MIRVEAKAMVTYICTLTDEDEAKVKEYAEENGLDFDEAIQELHENCEIDIYVNAIESDCETQEVKFKD